MFEKLGNNNLIYHEANRLCLLQIKAFTQMFNPVRKLVRKQLKDTAEAEITAENCRQENTMIQSDRMKVKDEANHRCQPFFTF